MDRGASFSRSYDDAIGVARNGTGTATRADIRFVAKRRTPLPRPNAGGKCLDRLPGDLGRLLETERRKVAKILHDGLTQELMAATFFAKVLRDGLDGEKHSQCVHAEALQDALTKAAASLQEIYKALGTPDRVPDGAISEAPRFAARE